MLVDTHCHLDMLEDAGGAIARMREAGVDRAITIGVDLATSEWAAATAASTDGVYATAGLHPHDAKDFDEDLLARLGRIAAMPRVVGIGEAGLDYHYDNSPRPDQRRAFAAQIALAKRADRTLVVHTRDAWPDTFAILEGEGPPDRVVFHCWSGDAEAAARAVALGAVLSFSGTVTFKNAGMLREAAAQTPLDRIVLETDSPFLAPAPHRGRKNEPAWVRHVAETIAAAAGADLDEVARATTANAERVFRL